MSPELITAVKERLELGYSIDDIRSELHTVGHSDSVIDEVFQLVQHESVNKVSATKASEIKSSIKSVQTDVLPVATDLFFNSFAFIQKRLDLISIIATPLIAVTLLEFFLNKIPSAQPNIIEVFNDLFSVIALAAYLLVSGAALYIVSESSVRTISFKEAFAWIRQNIWGLLWIYILVTLVMLGGFMLFIVPGIIVSLLVYFSQYVYVKENIGGLDALLRSRDLVKGNWLPLAWRLSIIGLMFLGVFLLLGGVSGLISGIIGESPISELVFVVILQFVSAGASLMGFHIGMKLYHGLTTSRPVISNHAPAEDKWKYRLLVVFGVMFIGVVAILLGTMSNLNSIDNQGIDTNLQQNLSNKERAIELRTLQN